jgi:hypothetical protein
MGLLDDAIREHLDLKRRHGAAEEEIARQEQEALGPPRRGEVPQPLRPAEPGQEPDVASEPAATAEETVGAYAAPAPDAEAPAEPVQEGDDWLDASAPPATEPAAPAEALPEEDVLEETPEFLQETPEHDRLWFEQKPPRDFDFDR